MMSEQDRTLDAVRSELRTVGGPFARHADDALTNIDDLAEWLADATRAMKAGEFVLAAMEDAAPNTLYLYLNEFAYNPDSWFVSALAFVWSSRDPDDIEVSELFDGVVGHEAGDVRIRRFTLAGMESLQACFAEHLATAAPSQVSAAEEFVMASVLDTVSRALTLAGDLDIRVALSRSDEPRIALWQFGSSGWSREVHVEGEE